jgi:predicted nucleic-acid-binding protein
MVGIDTNVLVRYIMQDDVAQSKLATTFMERLTAESPGYVTLIALVETVWVLESSYRLKRAQVADVLSRLLNVEALVLERAAIVAAAAQAYRDAKADFADALIERLSAHAGCTSTFTFDRAASKASGMTLLG